MSEEGCCTLFQAPGEAGLASSQSFAVVAALNRCSAICFAIGSICLEVVVVRNMCRGEARKIGCRPTEARDTTAMQTLTGCRRRVAVANTLSRKRRREKATKKGKGYGAVTVLVRMPFQLCPAVRLRHIIRADNRLAGREPKHSKVCASLIQINAHYYRQYRNFC